MSLVENANKVTILIIDDDDGDVLALQRAFKNLRIDHSLDRAMDGLEALQKLRGENNFQKITPPYLLIIDLNLPRLKGIDLIKQIRADKELNHAIIFVLTTSKREEDKIAAYDLNVAGYIVKETAGDDNFLALVNLVDAYCKTVDLPK
jgi:CheY-like chemotaxis protein